MSEQPLPRPLKPNVLVTGTPGTGKTSLCQLLEQELKLRHIEVGRVVKEQGFHSGFNEELQTHEMDETDEDKLADFLEPLMVAGGCVVDYHTVDFFPERWFELVVVLRASTEVHFDRLTKRGYSERKREENVDCEISGVVCEQALESYDPAIVVERPNNTLDEMAETVDIIADRILARSS